MSEPTSDPVAAAVESALRFAALSGLFQPGQAIPNSLRAAPAELALAVTQLAAKCDLEPVPGSSHWLLRSPVRRYVIAALQRAGTLVEAIAQRREAASLDDEAEDLLAVLTDTPPLDRRTILKAIEAGTSERLLRRIVTSLDRAGSAAICADQLIAAQTALAGFQRQARIGQAAMIRFVGRRAEQKQLDDWLMSTKPAPVPIRFAFVSGAPGLGKSSLLEQAVMSASKFSDAVIIRLDFDRPGLDVRDRLRLTFEAARQVGEQLGPQGAALLEARRAAIPQAVKASRKTDVTPSELASKLAQAIEGRRVIAALDTLEALQARAESRLVELFQWLDDLVDAGMSQLRVIGAGRGDALEAAPERVGLALPLEELTPEDAAAFLKVEGVENSSISRIIDVVGGHPLKLRLGAEIAKRHGGTFPVRQGRGEIGAAYLYRFLLSRFPEPDTARLAYPGLIVRRVNGEIIAQVLAPKLGLKGLSIERARELLHALTRQSWLMQPDEDGFLRHRGDMRALLLPLLYHGKADLCWRLDQAAARFFERRPESWAPFEAAYHRLQMMRRSTVEAPRLDSRIAVLFDAQTLSELPPAAQDVVSRARGELGPHFRGGSSGSVSNPQLTYEFLRLIEREDWREAERLRRQFEDQVVDPTSEAADAVRAVLWRTGRWNAARRSLAARDALRRDDHDLLEIAPTAAIVRLEMRAELSMRGTPRLPRRLRPVLLRLEEYVSERPSPIARQGALGFLLLGEPEIWDFRKLNRYDADIPSAARELWGEGSVGREARRAIDIGRGLTGSLTEMAGEADQPSRPAREIAKLTPYAGPAQSLVELHPDRRILLERTETFANAYRAQISEQRAQFRRSSSPVAEVADLCVLAEWAEVVAWFWRDPDLRLLGRSAERWRRTVAGRWSYGVPAPKGWRARHLDEQLRLRIAHFRAEKDPDRAALAELQLWCQLSKKDEGGTESEAARVCERMRGLLTRRVLPALSESDFENGAEWLAAQLLEHGAPAAFAVPVAVRLELGA